MSLEPEKGSKGIDNMMCFSGIAGLGDMEGHFQSHIAPFKHPSISLFVLFIVYLSPFPFLLRNFVLLL